MYGSNVEGVLTNVNNCINVYRNVLTTQMSYRLTDIIDDLTVIGMSANSGGTVHSHGAGTYMATGTRREFEVPISIDIDSIKNALKALIIDNEVFKKIEKSQYMNRYSILNGLGSPFTEMDQCLEEIQKVVSYYESKNPFNYLGEKVTFFMLLNKTIPLLINLKYALILYSDWLERGYNYIGKPNITKIGGKL